VSTAAVGLSAGQLATLFPFHVAFDRDLRIVQLGAAWAPRCPALLPGTPLADRFRALGPATMETFEDFLRAPDEVVLLECTPLGLRLRGPVVAVEDRGVLIFLGSPVGAPLLDGGTGAETAAGRVECDAIAEPCVPRRVLVADDNPVNRELIGHMLRRLGHRTDIAADGDEAVAAFRRAPYDLVLMDCQMPGLDGLGATRAIRAVEAPGRHTPILAVTGFTDASDRDRCVEAGMDDHLAKPVRFEALVALLGRWLPADASVSPPPAVDVHALERLRALESPGRPGLVQRLVKRFQEQGPVAIDALRAALARGDLAALAQRAHDLKSDGGNLGAAALSARCAALQQAGREGRADVALRLVPEVVTEIQRVCVALEAWSEGESRAGAPDGG
jgi:CheY-like chemotaxis protein/HPt (histidine-containing phosphotransfer) domain-containing protein